MGNGMDKIVEGIYVGSIRDSKDAGQLKQNNITHILSIHDNATKVRADLKYLCIAARDCSSQDLSQFFTQTNDFIHKARLDDGNVLVHCLAGVSRSVTVTVVYLMTVTKLGWRDTLNAVRGARRAANPNFGFQRQLLAFEHEKLTEERMRLLHAFGPSPYNDTERCRDLLEKHREWVLHGDSPSKDEDHNTYPLPHRAYGQHDTLHTDKADSEKRTKRSPRHTSFVDLNRPQMAKDQKTVNMESYLNIKAEKEAKQYFREQEEKALTSELMARSRSNQAVVSAAVAACITEGATGGAAASATSTTVAISEENRSKVDAMFNSS